MKIGIAFDTLDMYNLDETNGLHYDFAELAAINVLKQEIEALGYQTELLQNTESIMQSIIGGTFSCDLVYNTVEGLSSRNREGLLPALLEINKIPYVGTDAFGLSLTLNKYMTKMLAESLGILTPAHFAAAPYHSQDFIFERLNTLRLPLILKPNFEGNSSGICVCDSYNVATEQVIHMLKEYHSIILCEEFIMGQEITVPIIGNDHEDILFGVTTVNIQRNDSFWLDSNSKIFGDYQNIILEISDTLKQQFKETSLKLFNRIGCCDFARFDYRLTRNNEIYFIEVNPLPALFHNGSFDIVGQQYGLTFADTLNLIITTACKRLAIPRT
ncbi:D-alanine--D-alanine ligase [compost metagenome]